VPCYVGGGWYREGDIIGQLQDEIRRHLDAGYRQVKIKVGGAPIPDDVKRIEGALKILGDGSRLAVDANAALSLDRALAYAKALAPYKLRWFEEPCAPVAYDEFAEIAALYAPALGTGENLYCLHDVTNLLNFGGFRTDRDILQIDPPQAYGIGNFVRTMWKVEAMGGSRSRIFPHGGNMMSFQLVAGLGLGGSEAYPGVFGQFGGYAEGMVLTDGKLNLPECPGIGFEKQPALYGTMANLAGIA
jgi:L-alanine-DL-glutamate epimerase-like enolase superfamily enzyme